MIRVETTDQLKPGDVVVVEVSIRDRETGTERIWRRYACVTEAKHFWVRLLNLKMQVDLHRDERVVFLNSTKEKLFLVPEQEWPQGVVAMRMKHIAKGLIKLNGG